MSDLIKKHETLIVVALVCVVLYFGLSKYLNHQSAAADTKATAAQQVLAMQVEKNQDIAKIVQQETEQYQNQLAAFTALDSKLASAVTARDKGAAQQQGRDSVLPPSDLAAHWADLIQVPGVQAVGLNGFNVSIGAGHETVSKLELIPDLQSDIVSDKVRIDDLQALLDANGKLSIDNSSELSGLRSQLADADTQCKTQIADVKAKARKSKLGWFKAGAVVGFVAGLVTGHYL